MRIEFGIALATALLAAAILPATAQDPVAAMWELPVQFHEFIIYVVPRTADGTAMRFLTDTGGGLFILADQLPALGFAVDDGTESIPFPAMDSAARIPTPLPTDGRLWINPRRQGVIDESLTGMLGAPWFAGRCWLFDYPGKRLLVLPDIELDPSDPHVVPLAFQTDGDGKRTSHFPRIQVEIDGETFDLLFDTGAQTVLSETAYFDLGGEGERLRATSFITTTIFEKWLLEHPEWPVLPEADTILNAPMMRVPAVTVGGHVVGPIWFTRRPDANFHDYMSRWMDKPVDGALGGNCLGYFRITVDYPAGLAHFERPKR
jgi:hypothetical protein